MTSPGVGEPPSIPDSAETDTPPADDGGFPANPNQGKRVDDPEAEHRRGIERSKLRFAVYFVAATTTLFVAVSVLEYFTPGFTEKSGRGLAGAGDALKLLATTSLGFIFGRAMNGDN